MRDDGSRKLAFSTRWACRGGNLTESGLLGNWEAYSVEILSSNGIAAVESAWTTWTTRHQQSLLPLDNAEVRRQAAGNTVMAQEGDLPILVAPSAAPAEPATPQLMPGTAAVLVAEIPQSGNRWNQANFDLDNYQNFFGAREGADRLRRPAQRHRRLQQCRAENPRVFLNVRRHDISVARKRK